MNKHLLDTKLKSIAHYNSEIDRLKEAQKITESTLNDVLDSLKEFVPFEFGDVILHAKKIYRFEGCVAVVLKNNEPCFGMWLTEADIRDYQQEWRKTSTYPTSVPLSSLGNYKVIANTEKLLTI